MAHLQPMPPVVIPPATLAPFGKQWTDNGGKLSRSPPHSSSQLGSVFDAAVGGAFALMVGGVPIVQPSGTALVPSEPDCVEVGPVRVVGGVRPQNFDVGYRPDGLRFAFDSKTLNDAKSVGKNWQNMVNDLATEATTVHSRFPHAVVGFLFAVPAPCFTEPQRSAVIETLERLGRRTEVEDAVYQAEAVAVVVWNPDDGTIDPAVPDPASPVRLERFSEQVEDAYVRRYKGLPPHTA